MITLKINKEDGSNYWTEYFDDIDVCNKWIDEEKTRPYYKSSYTVEILVPEIAEKVLDYKELRAVEFAKIDSLKMEALVESVVENRTEKLEEYRALRAAIKIRFPKV